MSKLWYTVTLMLSLLCLISTFYFGTFFNYRSTSPVDTTSGYQSDASDAPCTFAIFRQAYKHQGYFPRGGRWLLTKGPPHYQPEICKFRFPRVDKRFVLRCLSNANISGMLTSGDSTGGRYSQALVKTSQLSFRRVRSEKSVGGGFYPDEKYFSSQLPPHVAKLLRTKGRFCHGCSCFLQSTKLTVSNKTYTFNIEHIAHTMILDHTLDIVYPFGEEGLRVPDNVWVTTAQELIFRYYLQDRYPDVFIVFLPFSHVKRHLLLHRLQMELKYFKSLIEEYIPRTTKVIYMPAYGEFEEARKSREWKNRLFENMLATEKIDKMNHVLYDVLESDLLDPKGRVYGFLDLIEASKDRKGWSTDGVHMAPVWYESVMSMFWETYCNSVLLNEF